MELLQKVTTLIWLGRNRFRLVLAHLLSHSTTEIYFESFDYSVVINKAGVQIFLYCLNKGHNLLSRFSPQYDLIPDNTEI